MTSPVTEKAIKMNVWQVPESSKHLQRNLVFDNSHLLVQADEMLLGFAESGNPIFRATTPLSRCKLKSQGHGKLSIHFTADYSTIETIFRIIVSANQLRFTEQLQTCVRNLTPIKIDQGNLMY